MTSVATATKREGGAWWKSQTESLIKPKLSPLCEKIINFLNSPRGQKVTHWMKLSVHLLSYCFSVVFPISSTGTFCQILVCLLFTVFAHYLNQWMQLTFLILFYFSLLCQTFAKTSNDHFVPIVFFVLFFYGELCFDHRTLCYASSGPTGALNLGVSGCCCLWSRLPWWRGALPNGQKSIGGSAEMTENRPLRQDCYRLIGVPPNWDAYYATECLSGRAEERLQALLVGRGPKCIDVWRWVGGWRGRTAFCN